MGALYGHEVVSDLPLRRLREGPAPRGRITVRRATETVAQGDGEPAVQIGEDFAVRRAGGALTMWCSATGTFALDPAERVVVADPAGAADPGWEHRLACVAVPLLLAEAGDLSLHASAVEADGGAIAFAGRSGTGKSTIAWALAQRGYGTIAEDGALITGGAAPVVWPGLTGVRLVGPSGDKRPVTDADSGASTEPVPLRAIVLLRPRGGSAPVVEPVEPVDALLALMPNTMHAQGPSLEAAFRGCAAAVRQVPVFRGTLPDDLAGARAHAEGLLRLVLDAARSHDA